MVFEERQVSFFEFLDFFSVVSVCIDVSALLLLRNGHSVCFLS